MASDTILADALMSGLVGAGFGFALSKSGVADPKVVKEGLRLERWTGFKTLLAAVGTGAASISVANMLGLSVVYIKPSMTAADFLGGAMMGTGLYLTGATPESLFAQIGGCKEKACWGFAGGVTGALAYHLFEPRMWVNFPRLLTRIADPNTRVLPGTSFMRVGIPVALICGGLLYGLENLWPESLYRDKIVTETELDKPVTITTFLRQKVWSPYVGGVLIGLLQIPALLFLRTGLGSTTTYATFAARIANILGRTNLYIRPYLSTNISQILLDAGIIVGGYLACKKFAHDVKAGNAPMSDPTTPTIPEPVGKPLRPLTPRKRALAFIGGFVLIAGARLANTCSTPHGIVGASQLSCTSLSAIATMFATGVAAAAIVPRTFKH